jgi:hypothetical protein
VPRALNWKASNSLIVRPNCRAVRRKRLNEASAARACRKPTAGQSRGWFARRRWFRARRRLFASSCIASPAPPTPHPWEAEQAGLGRLPNSRPPGSSRGQSYPAAAVDLTAGGTPANSSHPRLNTAPCLVGQDESAKNPISPLHKTYRPTIMAERDRSCQAGEVWRRIMRRKADPYFSSLAGPTPFTSSSSSSSSGDRAAISSSVALLKT